MLATDAGLRSFRLPPELLTAMRAGGVMCPARLLPIVNGLASLR